MTAASCIVGALACLGVVAPALAQQPPLRSERVATVRADAGVARAAAFSPDGRELAIGSAIGDVLLFDVGTGALRWQQHTGEHAITRIVFAPDGQRLACLGMCLSLHDTTTGNERLRISQTGDTALAWSHDGRELAYAAGRDVLVHDGANASVRVRLDREVRALTWSDDGTLFAGDVAGRVWRLEAGRPGSAVTLHFDHGRSADPAPAVIDVQHVAGVLFELVADGTLRRDATTFGLPGPASAFACARDARAFAAAAVRSEAVGATTAGECIVRWWQAADRPPRDVPVPSAVSTLAMRADGQLLFVATERGETTLHEPGKQPSAAPGPWSQVRDLALSPDGANLAVQGREWVLHSLDGRPPRRLPQAVHVQRGHADAELIVQYADRAVVLDARTAAERAVLPLRGRWTDCIHPGPAGLWFRPGALVDATGAEVHPLPTARVLRGCRSALAADGRWAVGGVFGIEGDAGTLVVTDARGENAKVVESGPVTTLAFSPDGARLAYLFSDDAFSSGTGPQHWLLRVREVATGKLLREREGRVREFQYLDDHRALVLPSEDLQVWDVDRLEPVQTLPLDEPAIAFRLSNDRRTLAIATRNAVLVLRLTAN